MFKFSPFLYMVGFYVLSNQPVSGQTTTDTVIKSANTINASDTLTGNLGNVFVKAFDYNRPLQDVPAALSYIGRTQLARFNNNNILSAVNSAPGVRMEERSPGSYRLNIRGSSMRAPFGVRNVKVYYDNIPITDPGGQTYLNQLGFYNVQSLEIIKGPGSSLYGAGTGGVMLIESAAKADEFQVNYSTGSYNLQNIHASAGFGNNDFANTISFQHQTSDGYREHTNMRRDIFAWKTSTRTGETGELTTNFLYGDLFYKTPGALTLAEFSRDPKQARPTVGSTPGSVAARAAIYQKTVLAGATYRQQITTQLQNTTSLYGAFTQVRNPTTRNYGRNSEPHFGGRTVFQLRKQINANKFLIHAGAELQQGFTSSRVFSNRSGNPDTLQTDDEINNRPAFVFSQLSWENAGWLVTAGASVNQLRVEFMRLSNAPFSVQKRKYNNEIAPRIAILRKLGANTNIYGTIAKGFSPPSTAELLPGNGIINTTLNAERGTNYETGVKGNTSDGRFSYDINAFFFQLKNTIVQRRDATGGDFYINAGSTDQKGLESSFNYRFRNRGDRPDVSSLWLSHTWNRFRYDEFKQLNNDFSGKQMPGSVPQTVAAGADLFSKTGLYMNLTWFYSDAIFLNDANLARANSYNLLGSKFGFKRKISDRYTIDLFLGADNLLNERYSLGNDLNAFGDRFYNAAPARNYFAGISVRSAKR